MIGWEQVVPCLTLAILGALHCAGMCGGFALAVCGRARGREALARQALYVTGKALSYAVLAALVAGVGGWGHTGHEDGGVVGVARTILGCFAGALLVLMGLTYLGVGRESARAIPDNVARSFGGVLAGMRRAFMTVLSLPGWSGAFGAGVANGLIPCGLSWAAVLLAAQNEPGPAALVAFLFGLATAPALFGVVAASRLVVPRHAGRARVVLGCVLVLFGAMVVVRAVSQAGSPTCCESSAASAGASDAPQLGSAYDGQEQT